MASADKPLPEGTDSILDEDGIATITDQDSTDADEDGGDFDIVEEAPAKPAAGKAAAGSNTSGAKSSDGNASGDATAGGSDGIRGAFFDKFDELRGQATDRAFGFAQLGKDRATGALDDVVRMVEDAASEIDAKVGTQYGNYARRAADSIGGFSDAFKGKEIDELFADARTLVQKSPAAAIGAAAALGFVVARLVRASIPVESDTPSKSGARNDNSAA